MSNSTHPRENMSLGELCQFTGLKPATFNKARCLKTGLAADLPYVRLGRRIIYRRVDVENWLAKHLVTPAAVVPPESQATFLSC